MGKFLVLLRGINVSGHKIIKMEDLRMALESSGFNKVKTYIQSGNIILTTDNISKSVLSKKIKQIILDRYGFDVGVVTLDRNTLAKAIEENPYVKEKDFNSKQLYVVFLSEQPLKENLAKVDLTQFEPDEFAIVDEVIYIKFSESASNSKLSNNFLESKLKVAATTRNWNTTNKLLALIDE